MSDLISRQAAIDAITADGTELERHGQTVMAMVERKQRDVDILEQLPSAEPEKRTEKRTETHACDLISRTDAIRIVDSIDTWQAGWRGDAIESIKALPSAQPEMIREIRKWINSSNRGNADYFIVDKIEEIINKYE